MVLILMAMKMKKFSDIGIEEIAGMIMDDLNNELMPLWMNLNISVARDTVQT